MVVRFILQNTILALMWKMPEGGQKVAKTGDCQGSVAFEEFSKCINIASNLNIPYIRVDKIKCRSGIIKFQYSDRLRDILKCKLSTKLAKRL